MKKSLSLIPVLIVILTVGFLFPSQVKADSNCDAVEIVPRDTMVDEWVKYKCIDINTVTTSFWPWEIKTRTTRTETVKWFRITDINSTTASLCQSAK